MSNWASFFLKIWHDFFGKGILEGKVIDEKEQPLQQAIIRLNNKEEAATSIQGTFLFENLRGKYTISIVFQNIIIENYDTIFIKGGDEKKIEIKLLQKYFPLPSAPPPSSENPIENPNQPLEQTTDTVTLPINPPPPSIDDSASEMEEAFYDEESFVTRLSSFSDKKWTEYYFELAEQIVNFNEIAHNAPMLAMTVPQKKKLPVSIGSRYILCLGEKKKKNDEKLLYIGFIVDGEGATLKKGGNVLHVERFNGKTEQDRPYWIEVECSQDKKTIDPSLIEAWLRAVRYEIQKKGRSPYQKNHNPFFYRAAKHPDYRKALFDRVFPNQPTNPPTQTNNVEIDTKPLHGVSGLILHVSLHEFSQVASFLNHIYSFISTAVKPYTYGDSWMLCDANSARIFYDMGQNWAKANNRTQDDRNLGEVGILSGMKLKIISLSNKKSEHTTETTETQSVGALDSEKTIKEKIWDSVLSITSGDPMKAFSPKEVIEEVHKNDTDVKANTIRCMLISDCVNHTSRRYYQGGKDRYWLINKGQFRLFCPESDRLNEIEQNKINTAVLEDSNSVALEEENPRQEFWESLLAFLVSKKRTWAKEKSIPKRNYLKSFGISKASVVVCVLTTGIRVEIYLSQDREKALFDILRSQQAEIEKEFPEEEVKWEPLKIASRVSVFRSYKDKEDLEYNPERLALFEWIDLNMERFRKITIQYLTNTIK